MLAKVLRRDCFWHQLMLSSLSSPSKAHLSPHFAVREHRRNWRFLLRTLGNCINNHLLSYTSNIMLNTIYFVIRSFNHLGLSLLLQSPLYGRWKGHHLYFSPLKMSSYVCPPVIVYCPHFFKQLELWLRLDSTLR